MAHLVILFNSVSSYHVARLNASRSGGTISCIQMENTGPQTVLQNLSPGISLLTVKDGKLGPSPQHAGVVGRVRRYLDDLHPDVVAVAGWSDKLALAGIIWCVTRGVPVIVMSASQKSDFPRQMFKELLKRRIVALFGAAVVGGRPHVDYMKELGMPQENIFVGYDVVDNDYFARRSEEVRRDSGGWRKRLALPERYFLVCSRLVSKKNIPRVLEAYGKYHEATGKNAASLVIAGDGPMMCNIQERVAALEVSGKVKLAGQIGYSDIPSFYALALALVHASTTEQWGLVINEAMASGLPVLVSSRCGCVPDLVRDGVNGFTFDPYKVDVLAGLMAQIASSSDLDKMGAESRRIVSSWTLDVFAENIWEAARNAAKRGPPRAGSMLRFFLRLLVLR